MNEDEIRGIVARLKSVGSDIEDIEVKEAVGGLPSSISETLSAFANGSGGVVILGLSEANAFEPAEGFDHRRIADALAQMCADKLTPPVRASIEIVAFGQARVVVGKVGELAPCDKPCYVSTRGMYNGSFIRSFDGDRRLSAYEIDRLLEDRTQPSYDADIVPESSMDDLDATLLAAVVARQRMLHPRVFSDEDDETILSDMRIAMRDGDALRPTLAGLLALGTYPQKFFPRLTVTFAAYPGIEKASDPNVKFLDSEKMVGPIPAIVADTVAAVRRNMRMGGVMDGVKRIDVPDYPVPAVREAVCNALMHRDYSRLARGTQVQVNLYSDRLEVLSPGGLYGTVTTETIGKAGYSSTRNQHLADILESVPLDGGFVAENRGTGFRLMERELERNGMEKPVVRDSVSMFSLTFLRGSLEGAPSATPDEVVGYIASAGTCSAAEISDALGIPRSTVVYRLRKLVESGKVERIGAPRSRNQRYRVV